MTRKIDIEFLSANHYKEIEIDVYDRSRTSSNKFIFKKTIVLDEEAYLAPNWNDESSQWELRLRNSRERRKLMNIDAVKFMVAIYENDEKHPYPSRGKLVMRTPLIDRYFLFSSDYGCGSVMNLYIRNNMYYDNLKK